VKKKKMGKVGFKVEDEADDESSEIDLYSDLKRLFYPNTERFYSEDLDDF